MVQALNKVTQYFWIRYTLFYEDLIEDEGRIFEDLRTKTGRVLDGD